MISIVIPIFNSERFIERCIESILCQTYTDYEILLVNDGSSDKSAEIIDRYANKYEFIRAFHNKNSGAGASREFGVSESRGTWIMFIDSDDTIPQDTLKLLIERDNGKFDIISGIYYNQHNNTYYKHIKHGELTNIQYISALLNGETIDGPCGKLIKRESFERYKIKTPCEIKQNEDMLMLINLAMNMQNVLMCNDITSYNYIYRGDSARSSCMPLESWIKLFNYIKATLSLVIDSYDVRKAFVKYRLERMKHFNKYGFILNGDVMYRSEMLKDAEEFKNDTGISRMYQFLKYPLLQQFDYIHTKTITQIKKIIKRLILRR